MGSSSDASPENRPRQEMEKRALTLAEADERIRLLTAEVAGLKARLERETVYLRDEIDRELHYKKLIGNSPGMRQVRRAIDQVAATDSTVLITGETGTGKELVARAIYGQSQRKGQLLVKVNCAALTASLIASELFGHEAGAFTGASKRRIGRFELAHKGTLFLDEVSELSAEVQVLLLRVLQERVIERVGGNEAIPVDVRLIAASNRDLEEAVRQGRFRADLFYRFHVFPIHVPPLRERAVDIPSLLHHFRVQFNRRMNKQITTIDANSLDLALRYPWPGNVRELENLVERGMIAATGNSLELDPSWFARGVTSEGNPTGLAEMERRTILEALERCQGKIYGPGGAAAALGLKPSTLYGKMRKHHIQKKSANTRFE